MRVPLKLCTIFAVYSSSANHRQMITGIDGSVSLTLSDPADSNEAKLKEGLKSLEVERFSSAFRVSGTC